MCQGEVSKLTFETLLQDSLVELVMASDGVTMEDLVLLLLRISRARAAREAEPIAETVAA
jgi:hypothetical protein